MLVKQNFYHEIEIRDKILLSLKESLKVIKGWGADNFAYRYFLPNGESYGFSTNDLWYAIKRGQYFTKLQKEYLGAEICFLKRNDLNSIIRTPNQKGYQYFNELDQRGMTNCIGIYRFSKDKIEHFFFISNAKDIFARDILINHLSNFQKFIDEGFSSLINEVLNNTLRDYRLVDFILDKEVTDYAFEGKSLLHQTNKRIQVHYKNQLVDVSYKELEIITYLGKGYSNTKIANILNISVKTVEWNVSRLKIKFRSCRNQFNLITKFNNIYQ